jgi:hypothetical protein
MTSVRLTADFHAATALIPAAITWPAPRRERKRLAAIARAVEFLAVFVGGFRVVEPAGVVHGDFFARAAPAPLPTAPSVICRLVMLSIGRSRRCGNRIEL